MARIVITSWGSYGDVNPYVGLAIALRARGHTPVLAIPTYYRAGVEREGLEHAPVGPEVEPGDTAVVARIMHARTGTELVVRELLAPAVGAS
jgi:UDP:flavonoid glycosyltransferase YjiC (YdhE family)